MKMQIWLEKRAALTPGRTALIGTRETVTFGELRVRAVRLARKLFALGVRKGDFAAILCGNGLHVPELIHALHYAGAVIVPLNTRLTVLELQFQIQDAGCSFLLYDESFATLVSDLKPDLPGLTFACTDDLSVYPEAKETAVQTEIDSGELHTIMYTSGTTGRPKGVMLSWENHWSSAIGSVLNLGLHDDDRWLAAVPLFHISGLSILMRSVIYGMPVVVHERFDPAAVNRSIRDQGVTIVSVVSNMLARMIDELGEERYPDHFRCMLLGGGPAPHPLLEACKVKGIPVFQTYGMTETSSQIVTLPPEFMLSKLGSAGKPLFPSELRIEHNGTNAPACTAGEIVVRGPNVTRGYWRRPDATAEVLQDGWLRTGDIGYVDEEGFLYVLDRRNDLIISGGENVYPAEIESAILAHPAILDVGVAGKDDPTWGQVPVAYIQVKDGCSLTEEEVLKFCAGRLAKYKIPAEVHFVDILPRNASNKLLRRELSRLGAEK